jgi:hypothetical protein
MLSTFRPDKGGPGAWRPDLQGGTRTPCGAAPTLLRLRINHRRRHRPLRGGHMAAVMPPVVAIRLHVPNMPARACRAAADAFCGSCRFCQRRAVKAHGRASPQIPSACARQDRAARLDQQFITRRRRHGREVNDGDDPQARVGDARHQIAQADECEEIIQRLLEQLTDLELSLPAA